MEVCRLCLDLLLQESTFLKVGDPYKCIINNVIPEVNLECTSDPVICNQCSTLVDELHKFKILCFETQQQLKQKCKEPSDSKLTVKEILNGTSMNDVFTEKAKERICRTCLESIEYKSFTILNPSNPDAYLDSMLIMCLPEVDLQVTRDPVMCEKCLSCLQKFHNLKTTCLDVEEKIKHYNINHGTKSPINLHNLLETLQESGKEKPEFVSITDIKSEKIETNDEDDKNTNISQGLPTALVKQEDMDIKFEE